MRSPAPEEFVLHHLCDFVLLGGFGSVVLSGSFGVVGCDILDALQYVHQAFVAETGDIIQRQTHGKQDSVRVDFLPFREFGIDHRPDGFLRPCR